MEKSKLVKANEKNAGEAAAGCRKLEAGVVGSYRKLEAGVVGSYRKLEAGVVNGYRKIEGGVVNGYRKIEEGAVGGFNKIADKFVNNFLTKEGESIEEAKERLAAEQRARVGKNSHLEIGGKAGIEE